ncbi:MAG: corrinoid protein [Coriobacteriia bacterium]|nr:corrinoid protein [Coriobacteriia bacterium]
MKDVGIEEAFEALAASVLEMDAGAAEVAAHAALDAGATAYEAIERGLNRGMAYVNERFERREYFIPELLLCSDAMYAGLEVLRPHLQQAESERLDKAKIVIGVVEGDTHDIGKNLVKAMLEASGFTVIDLGRSVGVEAFVDAAESQQADVIAMSTLMTTTMARMRDVVDLLEDRGLRDRVRVIVGGAPVSAGFAREIGADAYGTDAAAAMRIVRELATVRV